MRLLHGERNAVLVARVEGVPVAVCGEVMGNDPVGPGAGRLAAVLHGGRVVAAAEPCRRGLGRGLHGRVLPFPDDSMNEIQSVTGVDGRALDLSNRGAVELSEHVDTLGVLSDFTIAAWVRNPIDAFVLARLEAEGLKPAAEADRTFDMLMGSSVPPRRRFIQTHAKSVRNLDV